MSESITPKEYADLLFDGIGAVFKRLKIEEFDWLKSKIDWSVVERFPFPVAFEDQQYIGDEGKIHVYSQGLSTVNEPCKLLLLAGVVSRAFWSIVRCVHGKWHS